MPAFTFPLYRGMAPELDEYAAYPGAYSYKYPVAGERNSKVSVMTFDIFSKVTKRMDLPMDGDGYVPRIKFTRDPDKLAVMTLNRHQNRLDMYYANPRTGVCNLVLREEDDYNRGTIKSHVLTLAIAPLIVEAVILSAHLLTIWFKTGSFEGYSYIPVAYLGMYFLALFFASLVVFGAGVFRKAVFGLGFAGIVSIWCLIAAMVAVMSCPLFIQMGAGDESLSSFYNVTITGLVDYPSLVSLSTPLPDYSCLLGLFAIFIIAIALLSIGAYLMARRTSS